MRKTDLLVAVAIATAGVLAAGAWTQPTEKIVPVHAEPRHRLVFDSPGTRILDVNVPPGDTTLFHTHSDPILYVNMSAAQTRSQTLGGEWSGGDTAQGPNARPQPAPSPAPRPGRMTSSTSYAKQPLTHRVHNFGQTLFRLIGITNSSTGDESTTPSVGFDATPEISNQWFRGYRWTLDASDRPHQHANPVAIVLVSGRATTKGATKAFTLTAPGAFAWHEGDDPHSVRAIEGSAEVVEVEVRRPRRAPSSRVAVVRPSEALGVPRAAKRRVQRPTEISENKEVRFLVSLLLAAVASAQTQSPAPPIDPGSQAAAAAWVCPMHPDVMSAIPGKCPRCNMELVPAPASAYVCPMHPDVMSATPGKCPRCNMDLVAGSPLSMPDFRLKVETTPRVLKAGQPTKFRFTVHHPLTGEQARDFATIHDKLFHLFIVSRDLEEFAHVHPEYHRDGSFTIEHTLPKPGHYTLYSDFLARGGSAQVVTTPLVTAGVDRDLVASQARLTPDMPWVRTANGAKIELVNEPTEFLGGEEIDLIFRFKDTSSDMPITDLQRYLGAWGHLLILSEDMTEYVHAHPREETQPDPNAGPTGGPEIIFDALLPKPGNYKAWLQFQRNDRLSTVSFTFAAPRP